MIVIRKEIPNTGKILAPGAAIFFRIAEIYRHISANEVSKQTNKKTLLPRIISGNATVVN
jgi:hypothetical protein